MRDGEQPGRERMVGAVGVAGPDHVQIGLLNEVGNDSRRGGPREITLDEPARGRVEPLECGVVAAVKGRTRTDVRTREARWTASRDGLPGAVEGVACETPAPPPHGQALVLRSSPAESAP